MSLAAVVSVTQLAVLGSWGRSLRLTTLWQGIAVGFLVCGLATVALQFAWTRVASGLFSSPISDVQTLAGWTVDPFLEEIIKVAPLLWLAWRRPRIQRQLGYTDHLLYGAALGVGFELLESALRYVRLGMFASDAGGGYVVDGGLFGTVTVPSLWTALFTWQPVPAATESFFGDGGDTIQHLVWTALAAVGIAWLVRRKDALRLLGLLPLLLASLDHANYNLRVQLPPPISGAWSDVLSWIGAQLSWLLVVALLAAVAADRVIQARGRRLASSLLLEGEDATGLVLGPLLRVVRAGFPWSVWPAWQVVLSRRAAASALTARETAPHLYAGVAVSIGTLRRVARVPRAEASALWRAAVRQVWSGLNLRALRSPWMLLWAVALLPALAYVVIGAFPATRGLQEVMRSQVGLWLLVAALLVCGVLTAMQVKPMIAALRSVPEPSLHERRLRLQARLATAVAALAGGAVVLALAVLRRDPSAPVAPTYHVLDAISTTLLVLGLALIVASFFLFPPVAMVAVAGGGLLVVPTAAAGSFVIAVTAGATLASLGMLMNESTGSSSQGSGGSPRYTSNTGGYTRTYGRSVSDITGQARRWAARMEKRGYQVNLPPVRSPSKYGVADVTVTVSKNGVVKQIRHFIYPG
jgi:hypothetical protein